MATIEKRPNKNGFSWRVMIRKKNQEIYKSFETEEDANLYVFYKERLIVNMANFDVPVQDRVTLMQIMELKIQTIDKSDKRTLADYEISVRRIKDCFGEIMFYQNITFENWVEAAKKLLQTDVYRGAKTEGGKRKMSPNTLRKIFAHASAAVTHAQHQGIAIDNHPMKVMNTFIMPMFKGPEVNFERQRELLELASQIGREEPGPKLYK
jgi:hypothetical protein